MELPFSKFRKVGNILYFSGQIGMDMSTMKLEEGIENQTKKAIENIQDILKEEGLGLNNVIKTLVLLKDINDYAKMNEVYAKMFCAPYPARSAFAVASLPLGASVEIEVIVDSSI